MVDVSTVIRRETELDCTRTRRIHNFTTKSTITVASVAEYFNAILETSAIMPIFLRRETFVLPNDTNMEDSAKIPTVCLAFTSHSYP
jgi:hypothetical protein